MGQKLAPGTAVRFIRDGFAFEQGHHGQVVAWVAVQGDGSVVHTVTNLDTGNNVMAIHPDDIQEMAAPAMLSRSLTANLGFTAAPATIPDLPELSRGSQGEEVRRLQTLLNRIGSMLVCDGDFGGATDRAVRFAQKQANQPATGTADSQLWPWLEQQPVPFPPLSTEGVSLIAREETGGLGYYEDYTTWPHYPGSASGVTIGIGYDLRFKTAQDFRQHWGQHLPAAVMTELQQDIGQKGTKTRVRALRRLGILVPFEAAWAVFTTTTLPDFSAQTASIYPSLPRLPDLCRSVLVSLVYNRGPSLSGSSRLEMREIQSILERADDASHHKAKRKILLLDVEDQLLAMKRLWGPGSGLHKRRQTEANYWRTGVAAW